MHLLTTRNMKPDDSLRQNSSRVAIQKCKSASILNFFPGICPGGFKTENHGRKNNNGDRIGYFKCAQKYL